MFVACGLNHKTAPLQVREKIALPLAMQDKLLHKLVKLTSVNEAAILSTCNRTEIYCDTEEPETLGPWLAQAYQFNHELLSPYLYTHHGSQGVRHTLRVASGLDSMMLGESQILGQMKRAYQYACELGTVKSNLRQVFQYIFGASKRIRSLSKIGANPISVAYAAVRLIGQLFENYESLRVFIIGSGETSTLVTKYLHKQGVKNFLVASRTGENATHLATRFNGHALAISDIPQYLSEADVVISATACPLPFINKGIVEYALSKRDNAPMFFLDLAVPRDIEPNITELNGVHLYNIDDLKSVSQKGMNERRSAAEQAEQLIDCELENYRRRQRVLRVKNLICDYRNGMQSLAQDELRRAKNKLSAGHTQEQVLEEFCQRLVNKLTHYPTIRIRQAACDDRSELFDLMQYLFSSPQTQTLYEEIS